MSTTRGGSRRLIHATCRVHGGATGFTNVVVTREPDHIIIDPHVDGSCVIALDASQAHQLHQALTQWLT